MSETTLEWVMRSRGRSATPTVKRRRMIPMKGQVITYEECVKELRNKDMEKKKSTKKSANKSRKKSANETIIKSENESTKKSRKKNTLDSRPKRKQPPRKIKIEISDTDST